jgi:hypothetical protein
VKASWDMFFQSGLKNRGDATTDGAHGTIMEVASSPN